ncbi:MAG: hypothetical protein AAB316_01435, partial [Bacteroidota bacterium]
GEGGRELFQLVSQFHPKFCQRDTDRQFDQCLKHPYRFTIATFFKYAKDNGLTLDRQKPVRREHTEPGRSAALGRLQLSASTPKPAPADNEFSQLEKKASPNAKPAPAAKPADPDATGYPATWDEPLDPASEPTPKSDFCEECEISNKHFFSAGQELATAFGLELTAVQDLPDGETQASAHREAEAIKDFPAVSTHGRADESFRQEWQELSAWFSTCQLPGEPVRLSPCNVVQDAGKFVETHLSYIQASKSERAAKPYLERLWRFRRLMEGREIGWKPGGFS